MIYDITGTGNTGSPRDLLGKRNDYCYEGYLTISTVKEVRIQICHCGRIHITHDRQGLIHTPDFNFK